MTKFLKTLATAILFAVISSAGYAATLTIESGQLTGATGVDVSGTLYDVTFEDGTCGDVFDSCELDKFLFPTLAGATAAADALIDQVFLDSGPGMLFDTDPELTSGCSSTIVCYASVPYNLSQFSVFDVRVFNFYHQGPPNFRASGGSWTFDTDFTIRPENTWAVFAPAGAQVPLPAPILLLLGGLVGLGALRQKA